jgi:hypothetical protein
MFGTHIVLEAGLVDVEQACSGILLQQAGHKTLNILGIYGCHETHRSKDDAHYQLPHFQLLIV